MNKGRVQLSASFLTWLASGQIFPEPSDQAINTQKYYKCVFGPDSSGAFIEEIVPESIALSCDTFCVCGDVKTWCLVGPDAQCQFATGDFKREFADSCDRENCTCASHGDFFVVSNQRLQQNSKCLDDLAVLGADQATTGSEGATDPIVVPEKDEIDADQPNIFNMGAGTQPEREGDSEVESGSQASSTSEIEPTDETTGSNPLD